MKEEKRRGPPGEEEKMRLYLVDASSYAYRAYHATARQGLSTRSGLPTGAILAFTNMILKLIREEKPSHLVIVWDGRGKTFRHELYPGYKATRAAAPEDFHPQVEYMRKLVQAFNLPVLEYEGYEADDIIGTIARRAEKEGIETVIVSGDKDLTQLVSEKVTMLDTLKDVRTDLAGVCERMGVGPEQVVDLLALWGDSSDNVPGVPKIGEVTAKKLMAEYGSLEAILAHASEIKGKIGENLMTFAEQARLSQKLVTVVTDLPLQVKWEDFRLQEPDRPALVALLKELEFNRLLHEFGEETVKVSYERYCLILSANDLKDFVQEALKAGRVAVDTETTSLDPLQAELVGISLAFRPGEAVYVPVGHTGLDVAGQLSREEALEILRPLLTSDKVRKIGQNMKYDFAVLARAGVEMAGVDFDPMIASYLLNPKRRSHGLDELAREYLGHETIKYSEVCGEGKKQIPFSQVRLEEALRYSGEDVDVALRLADRLAPLLESSGLSRLFVEVEMPLVPVLARMEMAGVKIDTERLRQLSAEFEAEIEKYKERIYEMAGEEFNLDSPRQLGDILFKKLKFKSGKKTKTGYSTSLEVLSKLAEEHELPRLILEYRSLAKLKSTYTDALPQLVNPRTGRIHTSYNQTVTSTGRLSSSDPNLQNIPVRQEVGRRIRTAFVGEGDNLLLSADYSQIELRLMAHISEEPALLRAFEKREDIHRRTAAEIFGVAPDKVTAEQRRRAKAVNFGIMYGMSAHGLSQQLGVEHKEAQAYIDAYFARYPRVRAYMEKVVEEGRKNGFVSTIMGRRIPMPELHSANHIVRQAAEREAINAPLQGSAADIIKVAMNRVDRLLREKKFASRMIMQVHDELVFEAVPAELERLKKLVVKEMENAADLRVKLEVDVSVGRNWAEVH